MSFWPLAKSSRERPRALAGRGRVVEVGAGEGGFAARLASLGVSPLLIDPRPLPPHASLPRVRAASPRLPLRDASCGLIVLANTMRHLVPSTWPQHAGEWHRCLARGGELWVLEDDPSDTSPPARNYHRCLELLARADRGRGTALGAGEVRDALREIFGEPVHESSGPNHTPVREALVPLGWLRAQGATPASELDELEERIGAEGMAFGQFWLGAWRR